MNGMITFHSSSCGIAVYLSGDVGDPDAMFYSSPEQLAAMGATVHMQHNVTDIDPKTKTVTVTDLVTGETKPTITTS